MALAPPLGAVAGIGAPLPAYVQQSASPPSPHRNGIHLGVASCAGSTCHGAVKPSRGSPVRQDEYLIWSQNTDPHRIDSHHKAYAVLLGKRALRIAHNLGLPDAASANACLNCHADNAPPDRRGPLFRLSDGVGCEACHGAASGWLGVHLSGAGHKANLAAGLYPTDQPAARAKLCLSCHLGNDRRVMTHRIMGAGHPRLSFELDTFTAIEPAHFVVDKSYVRRKGPVNDAQIWAVGQAVELVRRMDRVLDPKNAPRGVNPELTLFDCEACHHGIRQIRWTKSRVAELAPGSLRLYDAPAIMLQVIAARVAPDTAPSLKKHLLALHRATTSDWGAARHQAERLRAAANRLIPILASHDFTRDDMKALADGVMAVALTGADIDYAFAEQATLSLDAIIAGLRSFRYVSDDRMAAINGALGGLYRSVGNGDTYRPAAFVQALRELRKVLPPEPRRGGSGMGAP